MLELDRIICGDCLDVLKTLPEDSVDAIVTDPPAGIAFMGKEWDKDKGGRNAWIAWMSQVAGECLRVIKPGGHALVWALPRTSHWTGMAWEEAGWEPRDKIAHVFGSGFPKSLDISKALDKMAGAEREIIGISARHGGGKNFSSFGESLESNSHPDITAPATPAAKQWAGWGSALKPAHEDWWLFRKPLAESTIAANVLRWGCGGLNIDGCRVGYTSDSDKASAIPGGRITTKVGAFAGRSQDGKDVELDREQWKGKMTGRFPANLIHDGSPEVLAEFAKAGERKSGNRKVTKNGQRDDAIKFLASKQTLHDFEGDTGSAARFFQSCPFTEDDIPAFLYYAKASRAEREGGLDGMPDKVSHSSYGEYKGTPEHVPNTNGHAKNFHPTVKPLSIMRYLCRLITPPGGLILDPFAGSGTTCMAAKSEGFHYVGIEREAEYAEIARRRIAAIPTSLSRWVEDARQ